MLPEQKLDALLARHAEVEAALSAQQNSESFVKLSREFAELEPVVDSIKSCPSISRPMVRAAETITAEGPARSTSSTSPW